MESITKSPVCLRMERLFVLTVALGCLAGAMVAQGGNNGYLKIEGVAGESQDSVYADWIEIDSFGNGIRMPTALSSAEFSPLVLRKRIDKSSPLLARACATGEVLGQVKLDLVRTDTKRVRYYRITMKEVLVSSFSGAGATGDGSLPESVELTARHWSWAYSEFEWDGRPLQDLGFNWDVIENTGEGTVTPAMRAAGVPSTDGQFTLSFPMKPGVAYRVLGATDLMGQFSEVQRLEPTDGGETVVTLPYMGSSRFFLVEELP